MLLLASLVILVILFLDAIPTVSSTFVGSKCPFSFKLYIYELPPTLIARAEEARRNNTYHVCRKCIYEQFALEYVIYDYFHGFCGRTMNPDEADFFYLPIIRDVDYRVALQTGNRAPSPIENALIAAIEKNNMDPWKELFQVPTKYWERRKGGDHIIVMPAPVTNLRHQSSARGFFHYMIQLNNPVFINVEFTQSFTSEYPICSKMKNIVAPYPSIDPHLFSGILPAIFIDSNESSSELVRRDKLLFYQGGHHGSCVAVRGALANIMHRHNNHLTIVKGDRKREYGFRSSIFCAIPIGDSPSSKRMYDVMNYGCIPVVLSDELVWAYSHETGGPLNASSFSIKIPQRILQYTATEMLATELPQDENEARQLLGYLPTGRSMYDLLKDIAKEEKELGATSSNIVPGRRLILSDEFKDNDNSRKAFKVSQEVFKTMNSIVKILLHLTKHEILTLQRNVIETAQYYRFYKYNPSLKETIPISIHQYPDGKGMEMIGDTLQRMKDRGIEKIQTDCLAERNRKDHKYIGQFPCEKGRNKRC